MFGSLPGPEMALNVASEGLGIGFEDNQKLLGFHHKLLNIERK